MVKRYKDGRFFDVPEEEALKIRERSKAREARKRKESIDYEAKIKDLENALAKVLSQLNGEQPVGSHDEVGN